MKKNKQTSLGNFFSRLFKKKKRICPSCQHEVDAYLNECPLCHNEVSEIDIPSRFQNMTFLSDLEELLLFLVGAVGFILIGVMVTLIVSMTSTNETLQNVLTNFLTYIVILIVLGVILNKSLKTIFFHFSNVARSWKPYAFALIGLIIIFIFNYAYSAILGALNITIKDNDNQSAIVEIIKNYPVLAFFFTVIFAPISEELTYRLGLFTLLRKRNRVLAYLIAILIFAFAHFDFMSNDIMNECINIPLYIFPAFILTAVYEYGGLVASTTLHISNNIISFIMTLTL